MQPGWVGRSRIRSVSAQVLRDFSLSQPTISIVTVCKNAGASIDRAIESVIHCGYREYEYVVVDGGSTDGTLSVIEKYRSQIDKYVSEPDGGISDALNKAVRMTDGKYHLTLHADDELIPGSLQKLADHARSTGAAVVSGSVLVMRDARLIREFVPEPRRLTEKMSVPHMGSLIDRATWELVGGYDLRRKIAMDHLLMLRILRRLGLSSFAVVKQSVARYFMGGLSDAQMNRGFREVRDNLVEEGVGAVAANLAYYKLLIKARMARAVGR
jgi:glycosyltransferase involved in cell wall biosynthesis